MARLIAESKAEITILGRKFPWSLPAEDEGFKIIRWKMIFKRGFLFYKWLNIRIFLYLLFNKADIILANDLDTLLPCYIISRIKRVRLVFDSHEYFTGTPELQNRHFVRSFWKYIERKILPHLDNVMTVNRSISDLYMQEYGIEARVVRNINMKEDIIPLSRKDLDIPGKDLLLVLQGTGINIDRGGVELFEAMRELHGVHLLVIGRGDALLRLGELSADPGLKGKVSFLPVMPWRMMMRYTCMADVGISLDKANCLNYELSLPNKIFDYINAGLAVITSNIPEITGIIRQYACGIIADNVEPSSIAASICSLRDDKELLEQLKKNSLIASKSLSWDNESRVAREVFIKSGLEFDSLQNHSEQ